MNSARWKNKIHKYFGHGIFALCARGTLNLGPICGKTLSGGSERKKTCLGFLGRKKFRFSAGAVEWGGGEAARGLLPPGFYGGREGRMGTGKGRRREGRCYSEPKPRQLGQNAGVVFTTNSPKSICYANLHSSHSPIHPNQYANLLLSPMQGGEVAAHLFRSDVRRCAVARRKAEIDTRASAPHGH